MRIYEQLTAPERFALMVEAMARKDDIECDRLEDSCPRLNYRCEDAEFRDRMRRAYSIASCVCLNMRAGLTRIRMADALRQVARQFAAGPAQIAEIAFLYGRAYGQWESETVDSIDLPDQEALRAEIASNPDLKSQMDDLRDVVGESIEKLAEGIHVSVGEVYACDLLSQWEGFRRFCQEMLSVDPLVLTRAYGMETGDPAAEVRAAYPHAVADEAEAARWAERWTSTWKRRFNARR